MPIIQELSLKCETEGFDEVKEKISQLNALLKETESLIGSIVSAAEKLKVYISTDIKN